MADSNKLILSKKYKGVYTKKQKDASTALYIAYTNANGKYSRYKVGIKGINGLNESIAAAIRAQEIQKIRLGEDTILSSKKRIILFDEIGEDYLKKQKQEKLKMCGAHKNRYYRHIFPVFKGKNIKDITPQDIYDFKHLKLKSYKPATVYSLVTYINSIFNHAIKCTGKFKGLNPAYKVFTKKEFSNSRKRWLNREEIDLLLETVSKIDDPFKFFVDAFLRLSFSTGGRTSSVLRLRKKDINITTREVNLWDAKNNEFYKSYLSQTMVPDELLEKLLDGLKPHHFIFYYQGYKIYIKKMQRFTFPIFRKLFNKGLDVQDKINTVSLYSTRHTFASLCVQQNDIFTTSKLLNHHSIEQTLVYAKVEESRKKDAIDRLF